MPSAAGAITNFTKYFREEHDVYVQNKSNTQVSLMFEMGMGRTESVLIPRNPDPINLTQLVPFSAIKDSPDFRKMINRRPPALILLEEEEYLAYYEKKAKSRGTDAQTEMDEAHQGQAAIQNKQAYTNKDAGPRRTIEELTEEQAAAPQSPDDIVTARVIGLCAQVGDDVEKDKRMSANQMLDELRAMELTRADLEYLMGKGYWKTVKKFAQKELESKIDGAPE